MRVGSKREESLMRASVRLTVLAALVPLAALAQSGPYTEQQAAAGRSSYVANCAGCHQPDLRGSNEARPLAGADFMRNWSGRTTQDLVAFMSAAMPPAPAA